ncbi:aminoglycoside phosphotransferase family protein [Archangium sp.]|jgi:streptomycin 6-kinase|uniref:aminoglycoside phosphotransferase family protein n=1 Tax=Archangium sp. TaxID=1872627 RepID=UPI002EDA4593
MGMTRRTIDIPDEVRRRVALQGAEGEAWVESLEPLITALKREWKLIVGRTLRGGSGSIVLEATTADGRQAVLKLPVPWLDPERRQLGVLLAAKGRGYAQLLRHHEESGALLIERLGPALSELGLGIDVQLEALCATLLQAWTVPPDKRGLPVR